MKYKSLFDRGLDPLPPSHMKWSGDVEGVLNEIMFDVEARECDSRELSQRVILGASRIVRGVLDYKIDNHVEGGSVDIVRAATDVALGIYSDSCSAGKYVEGFVNTLKRTGNLEILDAEVVQIRDAITWQASNAILSAKSANYVSSVLDGRSALFLLTGHGGIMAGLDVFLRYEAISGSNDSVVYPVRFSLEKKSDLSPRVDSDELSYLREVSGDKEVVIFDEDVFSGNTMSKFEDFVESRISPGKTPLTSANMDPRSRLERINTISVLEHGVM